jgi:hypothetical protein
MPDVRFCPPRPSVRKHSDVRVPSRALGSSPEAEIREQEGDTRAKQPTITHTKERFKDQREVVEVVGGWSMSTKQPSTTCILSG